MVAAVVTNLKFNCDVAARVTVAFGYDGRIADDASSPRRSRQFSNRRRLILELDVWVDLQRQANVAVASKGLCHLR